MSLQEDTDKTPTTTQLEPESPSPTASPPALATREHDKDFYSQDIVILAEDILFKLPRGPFEKNDVFCNLFSLPSPDNQASVEGSSDDNPLQLKGIKAYEFRALLWVWTPPAQKEPPKLTKDDWIAVLKLSDMWFIDSARMKAVNELSRIPITPLERIDLARRFRIPGWMHTALLSLAQQVTLSADDIVKLGPDIAAKLLVVRDSIAPYHPKMCYYTCNYCHHSQGTVERDVNTSFADLRRSFDFLPKIREVFGKDVI